MNIAALSLQLQVPPRSHGYWVWKARLTVQICQQTAQGHNHVLSSLHVAPARHRLAASWAEIGCPYNASVHTLSPCPGTHHHRHLPPFRLLTRRTVSEAMTVFPRVALFLFFYLPKKGPVLHCSHPSHFYMEWGFWNGTHPHTNSQTLLRDAKLRSI